jgi:hypothetical protein
LCGLKGRVRSGRREMLWPQDPDEILANDKTKSGCRIVQWKRLRTPQARLAVARNVLPKGGSGTVSSPGGSPSSCVLRRWFGGAKGDENPTCPTELRASGTSADAADDENDQVA